MAVEISMVDSLLELKRFVNFPVTLYGNEPNWVPALYSDDLNTLRKDRNPAFEFCEAEYWTAWKDGRMVGRIAGIINHRYIEKWGNRYARFGWIDFIDDREVSAALISTVEHWARAKGMEGVHGPMGFTDLDREGMLVEGFQEKATLATIYNYPYYPEHLEALGYTKDVDWIEFQISLPTSIPEKVKRVTEILAKRSGVRLYEWKNSREIVRKFGRQLFELIDVAYADLYGTTPLSERQVASYIKQYLGFVDPRFTKILVDQEDRLVGFGITMPSLSDALFKCKGRLFPLGWFYILQALKHPRVLDMYLVAVRPEYRARGVIAFLMHSIQEAAMEAGIPLAETNPELEDNVEVQGIWKEYPKRQHKRRRVYLKRL
ncbi:MAG: GCN5 family acetyltransferase [Spirochaetaceae bacterium]|nr:GCN5 family acetyltransferase [Spirochaetaceae bacterium]